MAKTTKNTKVVKEVKEVKENKEMKKENVKENKEMTTKETKTMEVKEETKTLKDIKKLTFEVVRNKYGALDVVFSANPTEYEGGREILNRLNEGYEKASRSERFNFFDGNWSTFRFNESKDKERGEEVMTREVEKCREFIQSILEKPCTMTLEEATKQKSSMKRERNSSIKALKSGKGTSGKGKTEKSKEKANTSVKTASKVAQSEPKSEKKSKDKYVGLFLMVKGISREDLAKIKNDNPKKYAKLAKECELFVNSAMSL